LPATATAGSCPCRATIACHTVTRAAACLLTRTHVRVADQQCVTGSESSSGEVSIHQIGDRARIAPHFLLQLAKIKGAHVIGVTSTRHEAFLADLGADQFLDYTTTPLDKLGRVADIVIDTVGGPQGYRLLDVLKRGGTLTPVFPGDYHLEQAADLEISPTMGQVHSDGTQMAELAHLIDTGRLRVGIDAIFPIAKAADAHQRADQGHAQEKIILKVV
jgi:NADPH:quinone reductase-like Zn-dependent oxidoreductase